jgi:hypothetical protein
MFLGVRTVSCSLLTNMEYYSTIFYYSSIVMTGVTKHVTNHVNICCNYSRTNTRLWAQDVPDTVYSRFSGFVLTFGNSQTKTRAVRTLQLTRTPYSRYTYHISHMMDLCYYLCKLCYPKIMFPIIIIVGLINPRWIVHGMLWGMAIVPPPISKCCEWFVNITSWTRFGGVVLKTGIVYFVQYVNLSDQFRLLDMTG